MAGFELLVYTNKGPHLDLSYFKDLLKPLQEDQKANVTGKFALILDFSDNRKTTGHYTQKRDIIHWSMLCYAFYTLDGQWLENEHLYSWEPFDWDQIVLDYFQSVPDDTWLYLLHCRI